MLNPAIKSVTELQIAMARAAKISDFSAIPDPSAMRVTRISESSAELLNESCEASLYLYQFPLPCHINQSMTSHAFLTHVTLKTSAPALETPTSTAPLSLLTLGAIFSPFLSSKSEFPEVSGSL